MPTLTDLKNKWFIPMSGNVLGVPCRRHEGGTGPQLSVSTDGNTVTPLIDGQLFMARWHAELLSLHGAASAEFMHAGWKLNKVKTLGAAAPGTDALEDINDADDASVETYTMACGNYANYAPNLRSIDWLRLHWVWQSCLDIRFPSRGSNHQKFTVMKSGAGALALLGSADISKQRWDRRAHAPVDPNRDPAAANAPTHEAGAAVAGPAVTDIEITYRDRWNDPTRTLGLRPTLPPQPRIATLLAAPAAAGTHSVQVLRTYGITTVSDGYSWSPSGEFTAWASYLNAITKAERYIYIEDQYVLEWGWPTPRIARTGPPRNVDIVYQLGEALKRDVKVAIVVPSRSEDPIHVSQKFQRDLGVKYLADIAATAASRKFVIAALRNPPLAVFVHAKVMIVDDEFVLLGTANICQRSMTHDGELHLGIVDQAETFAKELRKSLWAEHTGRAPAVFDNPTTGYDRFKDDTALSVHHLTPYLFDPVVFPPAPGTPQPPFGHERIMRWVDPYAGPAALA